MIEVRPDYGCHPLWRAGENIDPASLPIAPELADELSAWAAEFDATLNEDYPPDSGFASPEAEAAFWARGRVLAQRLNAS